MGHGAGVADEVVQAVAFVDLLAQADVLPLDFGTMEGPFDQEVEAVDVDRLGHEVIGPAFHGLDGGIDRAVSGHDYTHRRVALPEGPGEEVHAVVRPEAQVGEEKVDTVGLHDGARAGGIRSHIDFVVFLERGAQPFTSIFLVVDDKDGFLHGRRQV